MRACGLPRVAATRGAEMSVTASWSYTNTATVRPLLGHGEWGEASYGPEYEIACTWTAVDLQQRMAGGQSGAQGAEWIVKHEVFTEDKRPQQLDQIKLNGSDLWEEIRERTSWDMSPFGEEPDFKLVTG